MNVPSRRRVRLSATLATAAAALLLAFPAAAQTKLLRYPDVHGNRVAFCYGGDIWTASTGGGLASRVTAHPGQELFPKFSPDGKWIAFTGQYEGDEQVYVVPAEGGVPKRLTWYPAHGPGAPRHGSDNQVYGWTPDGAKVLFRSLRDAESAMVQTALYTVPVTGGLPVKLPMYTAGAGEFSPDGKRLVYSPLFRDFRTWKRYEGGWAQDLFVYDLAAGTQAVVAPSKRTERDPMWIGEKIFFVSDRDGTLNLYSVSADGSGLEKLTQSTSWDVRWASSDGAGQIAYELGGELRLWDVKAKKETALAITVPSDGLASRPARVSAEKRIEGFSLSPKGERALFVARGDVFTAPIEKGPTRNLTRSSNAHDKHATWSPDGKTIAFVSDRSGEEQLWLVAQDGSGKPEQLTTTFGSMLTAPAWSPDGAPPRPRRQGREALRRDGGREEGRRGRRRPLRRHLRLRLVARRRAPRVLDGRAHRNASPPRLERRGREGEAPDERDVLRRSAPPGTPRGSSSTSSRTASSRPRSPTSSGTTPATAGPASSPSPSGRTWRTPSPPRATR